MERSQPKDVSHAARPADGIYGLGDYELLEEIGRGLQVADN